jgi:hypothetical protein
MDERRTLKVLAWTVGSVVGLMFILNGIALSFVGSGAQSAGKQVAAQRASQNPAPEFPKLTAMRGG